MELKSQIFSLTKQYFQENLLPKDFIPGSTYIPVSGKSIDGQDLCCLVESVLDGWFTEGRFTEMFLKEFVSFVGAKHAILTNSGSSANLLAVTALTSPLLGKRRLLPGDQVITAAAGFPTTLNPILQNQLVPVLLDSELGTYNINVKHLEEAITPKTKAIILAHTLGNPFDLSQVTALAKRYGLWLIEDCCDALGSVYENQPVGSFGDISTYSFYPAHHITMGEGGALTTKSSLLKKIILSFRDWGRDCWCRSGCDNTCKKRFSHNFETLPPGYDHKYVYSHIGYNLKATDMQAALGLSQLRKVSQFIQKRRDNFSFLKDRLNELSDYILLPKTTDHANPSWFGFPITVSEKRRELIVYLEGKKIGTRLLFGGNLLHQPAYKSTQFCIPAPLEIADEIMNKTFWVGVHPGLNEPMLEYMADCIKQGVFSLGIQPLKKGSFCSIYD